MTITQQYSYRDTRIWMLPGVVQRDRQKDDIIIPSIIRCGAEDGTIQKHKTEKRICEEKIV